MAQPKSIKSDIRFRVYLAFTGICLFGAIIVGRVAYIQFSESKALLSAAKDPKTRYRTDTIRAERGNIYNEEGILLSSSIPEFTLVADFSEMKTDTFAKYVDSVSQEMANIVGGDKDADDYKKMFTRALEEKDPYQVIGRKLTYSQYERLIQLPMFRPGRYNARLLEERIEKRSAPYEGLASHTIGIFRGSKSTGLEGAYDSILSGTNGYRESQKATGVWLPVDGTEIPAQNGKDIVTTLDMDVQRVAENALMNALQDQDHAYGTCIVMEVKTGKIRALANLGKIDTLNGKAVDDVYRESYNYAMLPTEPGSTFKLVTLLSLFQDKYETPYNWVDARGGEAIFGGKKLTDAHKGLGQMPIWQAFAKSSNIAMSVLATKHYRSNPTKFLKHLYDLHLDQPTGIDLRGNFPTRVRKMERMGKDKRMHVDSNWGPTTLPWMSIGYEVMISPMHTCMLYNAVANNGRMMKPYLVSAIREYGKDIQTIEPKVVIDKIADSTTIAYLRTCLRYVVTDGTAKGIESPYYTMCGKTGTAQVSEGKEGYKAGAYIGSFVGYFPAEEPRYTICVAIRTHKHANSYYGGAIAAPVFRVVADKLFSENMGAWGGAVDSLARTGTGRFKAGIAPASSYKVLLRRLCNVNLSVDDDNESLLNLYTDSTKRIAVKTARVAPKYLVPDLRGMGLKDAIYVVENAGMKVRVVGKGRVLSQSLTPGSKIEKGKTITINLG
ncbi:MAG: PASTA domain-containing protein [Chitinophagia bacterium]|nr:PASTA domain-containing protein [Chitinophagia bacterium]